MKLLKSASIALTSLVAISATATADELADLKAEADSLTAEVAKLSASPLLSDEFKLLSVGESEVIAVPGLDETSDAPPLVNTIGIRPTADMPEATKLQWYGMVRAAVVHSEADISSSVAGVATPDDETDIVARGEVRLVAKTDTAVGEVGSSYKVLGDFDGSATANVTMSEAWGWWKLTDFMTLGGGYSGSIGKISHGGDNLTAIYSGGVDVAAGLADSSQIRLSYANGPLSAAVAVEHGYETLGGVTDNNFGASGEVRFNSPKYSGEIAAFALDDDWQVGVGATGTFFDVVSLSAAAALGHDGDMWWLAGATPMTNANTAGHADYWLVSLSARTYLSEVMAAELGYSHKEMDGENVAGTAQLEQAADKFAAGLYIMPVPQFTAGLEGSYHMVDTTDVTNAETLKSNQLTADIVTVFRF